MGSSKKKKKKLILASFGLGSAAIIVTVLFGYLSRTGTTKPPLPFEEIYITSKQLSRGVQLIDKSLSEGFYRLRLPQENIVFLSVLPSKKEGHHWDFSSIEVRVSSNDSVFRTAAEIKARVSVLPVQTEIRVEKKSDNEIIYDIYCQDFYTHRLRIIKDNHQAKAQDGLSYPKIGIIIDDLGYNRPLAESFLTLDLPLTFSVLPFTPNTELVARKAHKEGREIMLHLPMEPMSYPAINVGDGVLLESMDNGMILEVLTQDLNQVPFIVGVNNHMGSKFTENEKKMTTVLTELKRKGLYFIDSRTSGGSVALKIAKEIGLPAASRDIFLDNHLSESALKIQMERLLGLARHRGWAIGIGHPHKETLELLKGYLPAFNKGVRVVSVSTLVN